MKQMTEDEALEMADAWNMKPECVEVLISGYKRQRAEIAKLSKTIKDMQLGYEAALEGRQP